VEGHPQVRAPSRWSYICFYLSEVHRVVNLRLDIELSTCQLVGSHETSHVRDRWLKVSDQGSRNCLDKLIQRGSGG
jgi:hypothetical protein